jgi:hypothetical protein
MAANQINYQLFSYTDDNAHVWNKRGQLDTAQNAIDGSTPFTGGAQTWPKQTRRMRTREAIFTDPTTFRTRRAIIYTPTAFAALVVGTTTLAVNVPGNTAAVTYTLTEKIGEKQPSVKGTRQLTDHP